MTDEVKHPGLDAGRKARRSLMLALVHAALAVGILALFVFMQAHNG